MIVGKIYGTPSLPTPGGSSAHTIKATNSAGSSEFGPLFISVACAAGWTLDTRGSGLCEKCPANSYKAEAGNGGCTRCPANMRTLDEVECSVSSLLVLHLFLQM